MGILCLRNTRLVSNSLRTPVSLRLLHSLLTNAISTAPASWLVPRRATSTVAPSRDNLFEYTSGNWVYNNALRHAERKLIFDVDGLRRLAAHSVGRSSADVISLAKLAEGGFNRTFLITLVDGFQMVARVPYPATVPKYYAVASEVATMEFLRGAGLPVPRIFGYSPVADNEAKTEYIFMEFIIGTKLSDVWMGLGESDIVSILRQLVQLESRMMAISFPAGGSLYYAHDLEKESGKTAVPLTDERFCVGPDTRLQMWYGRRSQLNVDRGPYENAESALVAAARKELAYLEQFGRPLLPFRRERRSGYQNQEQSPSTHIENLKRYLLIAPSLVPRESSLSRFCIRHPDLQPSNIIVQMLPNSGWQIVSLLDWQHTAILPQVLNAGVPQRLQNHDDPVSQSMMQPSLPENFSDLDQVERTNAEAVHHRRLIHFHYVQSTMNYNKLHYDAFRDPTRVLRSRLFHYAGNPWEGETFELKDALIDATEMWGMLTGADSPCPIIFDAEDIRETKKLVEVQSKMDNGFEILQTILGIGEEGWVPVEHYDKAMALCKQAKEDALKGEMSEEEYEEIMAHWPWDDMDEENYM